MAQSVAMVRAAHQILDVPLVLEDHLALAMLGSADRAALEAAPGKFETPGSRHMRAFMVARARYAEDELAAALARGARQYVVLGAGLDTYGYRQPAGARGPRVFEVDHPATQAWKQARLAEAGIARPPSVTYVPVDLEQTTLAEALAAAGFERADMTFVSWLGTTPYLPEDVVLTTLRFIAGLPLGSAVVFDYAVAQSGLNAVERTALKVLMRRVARAGEPFRAFFEPAALAATLAALGFTSVTDLGPADIDARYFDARADGLRVNAGLARLIGARL
jgi:methyltransferase (TIGR00027 family)